jgi:hypothetical protein
MEEIPDAPLPSRFQIDDPVSFIPEGETEYRDGTVVAVRFTADKVHYDVVDEDDEVWGEVDSNDVEANPGEPVQPDEDEA